MSNFNVILGRTKKFSVTATVGGVRVPAKFEDLIDFDPSDLSDQYILMYDATTQKYKMVNPDKVLSASSTTETTQPGLPEVFVDTLDTDLDNKIDLDAGTF